MISGVPYFVIASSNASTGASSVRLFDNRHDSTRRVAQSSTTVKYTKPRQWRGQRHRAGKRKDFRAFFRFIKRDEEAHSKRQGEAGMKGRRKSQMIAGKAGPCCGNFANLPLLLMAKSLSRCPSPDRGCVFSAESSGRTVE
jgi:hypothetical protein